LKRLREFFETRLASFHLAQRFLIELAMLLMLAVALWNLLSEHWQADARATELNHLLENKRLTLVPAQ
jgi:hypothetical protein